MQIVLKPKEHKSLKHWDLGDQKIVGSSYFCLFRCIFKIFQSMFEAMGRKAKISHVVLSLNNRKESKRKENI